MGCIVNLIRLIPGGGCVLALFNFFIVMPLSFLFRRWWVLLIVLVLAIGSLMYVSQDGMRTYIQPKGDEKIFVTPIPLGREQGPLPDYAREP